MLVKNYKISSILPTFRQYELEMKKFIHFNYEYLVNMNKSSSYLQKFFILTHFSYVKLNNKICCSK